MSEASLVFDVGKTHVKVSVLDDRGHAQYSRRTSNKSTLEGDYPSLDIETIWNWFTGQCRLISANYPIGGVAIATHGAAAVLIDQRSGAPVLAPMDYEYDGYPEGEAYSSLRAPFSETFSPSLPAGLNLGRQLHYQLMLLDEAQRRNLLILPYASYWSWRLTGVAACELTSLGCHTDLWNIRQRTFSSLADKLSIRKAFPQIVPSNKVIGTVLPGAADATGLSEHVRVLPGLHDSNAGYYPYLSIPAAERPTVISTGTWCVALSPATPLDSLDEARDMLANIDGEGNPLATARYMGGREFAAICEITNCDIATDCTARDVADIIRNRVLALPCFSGASGPYGAHAGKIAGRPANGKALATVYSALMLDDLLHSLARTGDIVIEGSFASNDLLCALLAALRPGQDVYRHPDAGGVVDGCYCALHPEKADIIRPARPIEPLHLPGLELYRNDWRAAVGEHTGQALPRDASHMGSPHSARIAN